MGDNLGEGVHTLVTTRPGVFTRVAWLVHSMGSLVRHIVILTRLGLLELWRPLLMPTPDGW